MYVVHYIAKDCVLRSQNDEINNNGIRRNFM